MSARGWWRALWRKRSGEPRVVVPALVIIFVTLGIGLAITAIARKPQTETERALALATSGRVEDAETSLARLAREKPTVEIVLALLEVHIAGKEHNREIEKESRESNHPVRFEKLMSDADLDAILDGLPPEISLVVSFYRLSLVKSAPEELRNALVIAADRDPPIAWANHVLAMDAQANHQLAEAAIRYEREGSSFPERAKDLDAGLRIRMRLGDWDGVRERLADPKIRDVASTTTLHLLAEHDNDWKGVVKYIVLGWFKDTEGWTFVVAGVAALAWAFVCARLGKLGEAPRRRVPLYVTAFVLGVISVVPTLLVISLEHSKLKLEESGDATRDLLFFVFGVGLREEGCKLLLFLPLLPVIRKWGDKLDVLVCGAMVGLGFAAEENLNYLASGNLHTGLARFVMANFFHMAMTGTLAAALDDLVTDREKHAMDFTKTALMVIAMHGAYDFLLSHPEYGGVFMATIVFVFLTRIFLSAVERARKRVDRGLSLLHAFVIAIGVVTGVAAVRAVTAVGPLNGAVVMGEGLLGEAIVLIVFVRTLGAM